MIRSLLFLFLLLPAPSSAQTTDTTAVFRRFQLGVGFGALQHELDVTPSVRQEPFPGTAVNLALRYFNDPTVGFQAELGYVRAGWREELLIDGEPLPDLYERRTDYAELLILTQLSIGRKWLQPLVQAGPYLSVPLSTVESIPAGYVAPESTPTVYYGFDLPFRVNYGLLIGVGLNLEFGPVTLQGQGRYLLGFSDLIRTGLTTASTSRRAGIGWHANVFYAF